MVVANPMPLMFLGERRIAQKVLVELERGPLAERFDVRVLVSNREFAEAYRKACPGRDFHFILNDRRRAPELLAAIAQFGIVALFSVQHVWILPSSVLDAVRGRAFNLHNSRMPDYKGYNSVSHALLNDDQEFISTVHWMAPEVDSGDIAYIGRTPIRPDDTAVSLYVRSTDAATAAAMCLLTDLASGREPPRRRMAQGGVFYGRGAIEQYRCLNGVSDPVVIARRARALFFPPQLPAFFESESGRVYVVPHGAAWPSHDPPANAPVW